MTRGTLRIPYDECPLCRCRDLTKVGSFDCSAHPAHRSPLPTTMRWVRCVACGHVFTDGYWSEEALTLLFSDSHAHQSPDGVDIHRARAISAPIVEAVTALRAAPAVDAGRWLDVGFGNGALLTTAEEYGYEVLGLDLRESSVSLLKEMGYDARCAELSSISPEDGLFDVISMADVVEHMAFPTLGLRDAHGLLSDGGLLLVSMPNMDCLAWRALDRARKNPYWTEIEHHHNFGRRRLYALLTECGFVPCRYGISSRYVACMEVVARKAPAPVAR